MQQVGLGETGENFLHANHRALGATKNKGTWGWLAESGDWGVEGRGLRSGPTYHSPNAILYPKFL